MLQSGNLIGARWIYRYPAFRQIWTGAFFELIKWWIFSGYLGLKTQLVQCCCPTACSPSPQHSLTSQFINNIFKLVLSGRCTPKTVLCLLRHEIIDSPYPPGASKHPPTLDSLRRWDKFKPPIATSTSRRSVKSAWKEGRTTGLAKGRWMLFDTFIIVGTYSLMGNICVYI